MEQKIDEVYRYMRKHQYQPRREEGHHSRGVAGGSSVDLMLLGGRMTPVGGRLTPSEIGGGSGTVTPQRRGREMEGVGMGYFESPLR